MSFQVGTNLGKNEEMRELAKIKAKQNLMEQRRLRILNTRQRTIGIDVAALDAQCAERQQNNDDEKEAIRIERMRNLEIDRVLASVQEEENQIREYERIEIKKSWESALEEKETKRKLQDAVPAFNRENCGLSSLMEFAGEDPHRGERLRLQKEQVHKWMMEQIAEKEYAKQIEDEENTGYASLLRNIDQVREDNETEEAAMRKAIRLKFAAENDDVRRLKDMEKERDTMEGNANMNASLPIINEDLGNAMDENGRIIRKDMFKGFSLAQQRRMLGENAGLHQHQIEARQKEADDDRAWGWQQALSLRAMETAYQEEESMKNRRKEDYLQDIKEQMVQQQRDRKEWDDTAKGAIGNKFFNAFGSSAR